MILDLTKFEALCKGKLIERMADLIDNKKAFLQYWHYDTMRVDKMGILMGDPNTLVLRATDGKKFISFNTNCLDKIKVEVKGGHNFKTGDFDISYVVFKFDPFKGLYVKTTKNELSESTN